MMVTDLTLHSTRVHPLTSNHFRMTMTLDGEFNIFYSAWEYTCEREFILNENLAKITGK